jgi:hypothetical protein
MVAITRKAAFEAAVATHRQRQFHPAEGPLRSADELLRWVDQIGFCLLSPHEKFTMPNVAENADGRFRLWRDRLITDKQVYYGRPFRLRAGFVSLRHFPALYALSPTGEYDGDRFELYRHRLLSADANRIAGVVHAKGPLPTRTLRREAGLAGEHQQHRFRRAVIEAEARFLIAKIGIGQIKETRYTFIWDAVPRHLPDAIEQASALSVEDAAHQIMVNFVSLVADTTVLEICRLFALNPAFVRYMLEQPTNSSHIQVVYDDGLERLVSETLPAARYFSSKRRKARPR